MDRLLVLVGAISMFFSVLIGAFGAHGLKTYFENNPYYHEVFQKAVFYQMIHSMGILIIACLMGKWTTSLLGYTGASFVAGIVLFSGSLYTLSLMKMKWMGAITPLGGIAFTVGWVLLIRAAMKG